MKVMLHDDDGDDDDVYDDNSYDGNDIVSVRIKYKWMFDVFTYNECVTITTFYKHLFHSLPNFFFL